jgi:hypothetical protein
VDMDNSFSVSEYLEGRFLGRWGCFYLKG